MKLSVSACAAAARKALLSMAFAMWASGAVSGVTGEVTPEERTAYENALLIPPVDHRLHDADSFLDGAKGHWSLSTPPRASVPVYPAGMTREDDLRYWQIACHMSLVATATNLDSTAFLTTHQNTIVTRSRFRIDHVVRGPSSVVPGSTVALVRQGGEVVDAGERLRVIGDFGPFIAGQRYFLLAYQDEDASPENFVQLHPAVILEGGVAYVQGGLSSESVLTSPFEVQRFTQKLSAIASTFPCKTP